MGVSSSETKEIIKNLITSLMDRVLEKVLVKEPFIPEMHHAQKPLYAALVPDEIFKGSHFERRFVTPFGKVWEKLSQAVAKKSLGHAETSYRINGLVKENRLKRISEVLNNLEHIKPGQKRIRPNWQEEFEYIIAGGGELIPTPVECDLFVHDIKNNKRYSFELKAPLPNSDQAKVSKEKIFKLYCMEPMQIDDAYFALPYNPYGKKEDYKWSFPTRWFDMKNDHVVLIGDEFWDKLGGVGTYQGLIEIINSLGLEYRIRIYREFLGIEPPKDFDKIKL
ncbi:MAG: TdeIII family type II restriction endonuclease [Bacteroidetes bacterium]|nr:TdeIII family type II restriction endonuclease [Bacteroidota bacterium]